MRYVIVLIFASSFLFFACEPKKEENANLICKKSQWDDGSIKAEGCYINDSIKEGSFKRYFRNGQLEYEANYKNNKNDGIWLHYFENGQRHAVAHYENGRQIGASIEYYYNGTIKEYKVFNLRGTPNFKIEYAEDGAIKIGQGAAVTDYSVNKDTLKVGDVLKIDFIVATPQKSEGSFQFYEDAVTKKDVQYLKVNKKDEYGTVTYEKLLKKKGTMNWGATYIIKFEDRKQVDVKFKLVGISTVR